MTLQPRRGKRILAGRGKSHEQSRAQIAGTIELEDKGAKGGRAKGRVLVSTDRKDRRFDERGWGTSCRSGNEGEEMKYQWRGYVGDEEKKAGRRTGTRWWRRRAAGDGIADKGGLCMGPYEEDAGGEEEGI